MELYDTINNVNGGTQNDLHVLRTSFEQECSRGADLLLALGEYRINKHLTRVQAQATGHCRCESMSARCILPGSKHKQEATAGVKVKMLKAFYQEHIIMCK